MTLKIFFYLGLFVIFFLPSYVVYPLGRKWSQGMRLRNAAIIWLTTAIIFTAMMLVFQLVHNGYEELIKTFWLGALLTVPLAWLIKRSIEKSIDGERYCCHGKNDRWILALVIALYFTLSHLVRDLTGGVEASYKFIWIFSGLGFSLIFAQAYILKRVIEIETQIGKPILIENHQ